MHDGKVEAVWFRCQMLPFRQSDSDGVGTGNPDLEIEGITFRTQAEE